MATYKSGNREYSFNESFKPGVTYHVIHSKPSFSDSKLMILADTVGDEDNLYNAMGQPEVSLMQYKHTNTDMVDDAALLDMPEDMAATLLTPGNTRVVYEQCDQDSLNWSWVPLTDEEYLESYLSDRTVEHSKWIGDDEQQVLNAICSYLDKKYTAYSGRTHNALEFIDFLDSK